MPWPQVLYYVRSPKHLEALWFANVGNQVLWWTYVKACWRAVGSIIAKKGITFKTTMKVPTPRNPGSAFQCTSAGHSISEGRLQKNCIAVPGLQVPQSSLCSATGQDLLQIC